MTGFQHTNESQAAFAELSGDFNPVHLDPTLARRTLFGQIVVHGLHNVLRALEQYLQVRPLLIDRLAVTFKNPVFLNEDVSVVPSAETDTSALLTLRCGAADVANMRLMGHAGEPSAQPCSLAKPAFPGQPEDNTFLQLETASGTLDLMGDEAAIRAGFPACSRALGVDGVARLLGLTRLVGMRCPGLHSLFSGFDVRFADDRSPEPTRFNVARADGRMSMLAIAVDGGGMTGTVSAFVRPAPVDQPDMVTVADQISGNPYQGVHALVVGGSRGLGEVSAKIIAAGGGDVAITYLSGRQDAERVRDEINQWGGRARALQMDASNPDAAIAGLHADDWTPTHLLYFATPRISGRAAESTDGAQKAQFDDIYSTGLKKVVGALRSGSAQPLAVFYPSSVYVVECPADLADYARAKTDGEAMARDLAKNDPGISLAIERLPALATDQTASLLDLATPRPLEVMAQVLGKTLC